MGLIIGHVIIPSHNNRRRRHLLIFGENPLNTFIVLLHEIRLLRLTDISTATVTQYA